MSKSQLVCLDLERLVIAKNNTKVELESNEEIPGKPLISDKVRSELCSFTTQKHNLIWGNSEANDFLTK